MDINLKNDKDDKLLEPFEYFANLKSNVKFADDEFFVKQIEVLKEQISLAHKINQKSFLYRLSFTYETVLKEQVLCYKGMNKYVLKDDLLKTIDKITPRNSVKIIELDRYPRPIPTENLIKIAEAQKLNIFDGFFVVFTDFTDQDYQTNQDKEVVSRNRDPIVFGWFKHDPTGYKHDRCYLVTDWVDEYCDLDFTKLLTVMSENGIESPEKTLKAGHFNLEEVETIVKETMEEMNNKWTASNGLSVTVPAKNSTEVPEKKNFFDWLFNTWKK